MFQDEPSDHDIMEPITSLSIKLINKEDRTYTVLKFLIPIAEYGSAQLGVMMCDRFTRACLGGRDDDGDVESGRDHRNAYRSEDKASEQKRLSFSASVS
ncbi:unnamed protein product [Cylicostephanus goldi]|uniref:Uncharacterized protein n=1 Tax=Cylicostephanus goldi TaxID=71465 RepID=A0A3P7MDT4_CYLGO|nr:unnamed protein product [Cylicostephanus goldi]